MAYDLNSFYSNALSANNLSKTIVEQMMNDARFSSLSKITLAGINYGSGSASSTIIGYTETGKPIYNSSVTATMNDELLATIEKAHTRNNDTMLRGIGSNVIENTSTGNIVTFASQGVYKAFITQDGFFTGKVKLENIADLNKLTLDTSRFYIKSEVDSLLAAKLSYSSIFNDDKRIKTELLDRDVVLAKQFDPHVANMEMHITGLERSAWNAKYDKPVDGISYLDIANEVVDRIKSSALNVDLQTHVNNKDIHTSTTERNKWNAKYDKPATGVPMTDLSEIVQTAITNAATKLELGSHTSDKLIHITNLERTAWNAKYDKPAGGIPQSHLEEYVQDILNTAVNQTDFAAHKDNAVVHITNDERIKWNAQYTKPATGVPETDLEQALKTKINSAATVTELANHTSNNTVHISELERQKWNNHKDDTSIHIKPIERTTWNGKYEKPSTGIPETDLTAGLQTKINSMTPNVDFIQHDTDTTKHVASSERTAWNGKYEKPLTGIPKSDLTEGLQNKIDATATNADLVAHVNNVVAHITELERKKWNDKYDKLTTGIPETDLAMEFRNKVADKVSQALFVAHTGDTTLHVSVPEKTKWNAQYTKPTDGVPMSDLHVSVSNLIKGAVQNAVFVKHDENAVRHVTAEDKAKWNGQYTKLATGIPETDLEQAFRAKVDSKVSIVDFGQHDADTVKHITASERNVWNAKYDKPQTGVPMTDLSDGVQTLIKGATQIASFNSHVADAIAHVTSVDRSKWDGKYVKPTTGIPATDLTEGLQSELTASKNHQLDTVSHVTAEDKAKWSAKYDKPVDGIGEADLAEEVTIQLEASKAHLLNSEVHVTAEDKVKINKVDTVELAVTAVETSVTELKAELAEKYVRIIQEVTVVEPEGEPVVLPSNVTEGAVTSVVIPQTEHKLVRENAYDLEVKAMSLTEGVYETVTPTSVKIDATTKDVTVIFATDFLGVIILK